MMIGQARRLFELNSILQKPNGREDGAPVIAFTSGKGGTGKSFIALNVALLLSRKGLRVLLLETDITYSGLRVLTNSFPLHTLADYINDQCLIHAALTPLRDNLDVIFGGEGNSETARLFEEKLSGFHHTLRSISRGYDVVIIDTQAGASGGLLSVISAAELCVIVGNPEPTAVMDAYVVAKIMHQLHSEVKLEVIFNKCLSQAEGETAYKNLTSALQHFLGKTIPLGGILLSDDVVRSSIMNQSILVETIQNGTIITRLQTISDRLTKNLHLANNNQ